MNVAKNILETVVWFCYAESHRISHDWCMVDSFLDFSCDIARRAIPCEWSIHVRNLADFFPFVVACCADIVVCRNFTLP